MRYIIVLFSLVVFSCQPAEEDGHAHAPDGSHVTEGIETPTLDATIWTDKTELFVEFPALVVGSSSRFAAHFTFMEKHKPVREGSVTVSLVKGDKGIRHTVDAPSSPGIFRPILQPKESGIFQLIFDIKTPTLSDRIVMNDVRVFASVEEAIEVLGGEESDDGSITFLKEQAWKIDFQTAQAEMGEVYEMIPTSGIWKVSPSDYQTLPAPVSGTVTFSGNSLNEGTRVRKGQILMTVSSANLTSNNMDAQIKMAKANFDQAKSSYERKQKLFESKIVSKAEFEQEEQKYLVAKSKYETLSAGYGTNGKQVIVPFDGYIKSLVVNNGAFVEEGASLLTITSHKSSLLEAQVSSANASKLNSIFDIWYQPKEGKWSSLNATGGKILSIGKEVERDSPLLSIYSKINDVVEMPEGSFTEVQLSVGKPRKSTVIPTSSLLEDYGSYSVIVELSGESFERRPVTIGRKNGNLVEITSGLEVGEMVVSIGAYQVKMAAMSGAVPAHGHDH
ncbi:MAG: efflux RND transporter periplasmic adaptor subunit [Ekhidna sp.]|uniref:efflux RND transporter periplasmic adaptor subunit n=1 Tax=Ekhidna sp. TaxID=2608089 RepID=UPI0032ED654E